jgi:hypothetical protein
MKKSDDAVRAIRAAKAESQVIAAVQEYLASLGPSALGVVPAEILAVGLRQAEEVIQSALEGVHEQMLGKEDSPQASLLNDLELVLSTAAKRLAVLARDTA